MKGNTLTIVLLVILGLAIAGFFYKRYKVPPAIALPDIALTDLNGQSVSLNAYAGKPLFISFFATWCGPCMRELPELAELRTRLSDQHLQMVCICDEPIEKLKGIQERFGDQLVVLHSVKGFHDIGIYTYPTNYIFNTCGEKVYNKVDAENWTDEAVTEKVRNLIK